MSEHKITVESGASVRLATAGKYCDRDIVVTAEAAIVPVVTNIDYSSWASGSFKETLDNGSTLEYAVEFDGNKPIKVTTPTGEGVIVKWPADVDESIIADIALAVDSRLGYWCVGGQPVDDAKRLVTDTDYTVTFDYSDGTSATYDVKTSYGKSYIPTDNSLKSGNAVYFGYKDNGDAMGTPGTETGFLVVQLDDSTDILVSHIRGNASIPYPDAERCVIRKAGGAD